MKVSDQLKKADLWEGSELQIADNFGYLTREMLVHKRDCLRMCDDLTPKERAFLAEINAELAR